MWNIFWTPFVVAAIVAGARVLGVALALGPEWARACKRETQQLQLVTPGREDLSLPLPLVFFLTFITPRLHLYLSFIFLNPPHFWCGFGPEVCLERGTEC